MRIESVPDGADITLNGKFIGTTPAAITIEPGSFRLMIQKDGFAPWERTIELLAHSSQTVRAELIPGKRRLPEGVTAPRVLSKVDPSYSPLAKAAAYGGTVVIDVVVAPTGEPRDIRVVRGLGLGLDEKAIEAVQQWKFQPGTKEGQPVAVKATIEVNFRLLDDGRVNPHWRLSRAAFQPPKNGTAPVLIEFTRPRAHANAKSAFAKLQFEVDEEGLVQNPRLILDPAQPIGSDIDPALKKHLLAATKLWRFTPAQEGGKPISSTATFDFIWSASGN